MGTFVLTTAIFKNGRYNCHRSQRIAYLKSESPETYNDIPQLLLCMPYLLRYRDIEFGSHFEKWSSPRIQFLKFPPSRILKPYLYVTQINSQTLSSTKCLRAYTQGRSRTIFLHACVAIFLQVWSYQLLQMGYCVGWDVDSPRSPFTVSGRQLHSETNRTTLQSGLIRPKHTMAIRYRKEKWWLSRDNENNLSTQ